MATMACLVVVMMHQQMAKKTTPNRCQTRIIEERATVIMKMGMGIDQGAYRPRTLTLLERVRAQVRMPMRVHLTQVLIRNRVIVWDFLSVLREMMRTPELIHPFIQPPCVRLATMDIFSPLPTSIDAKSRSLHMWTWATTYTRVELLSTHVF